LTRLGFATFPAREGRRRLTRATDAAHSHITRGTDGGSNPGDHAGPSGTSICCTRRDPFAYGRRVTKRRLSDRTRPLALAYVRVSTEEQVAEGASLDAQCTALLAEGERRNWDVEVVRDEGLSAKTLDRPGLTSAIDRLDRGEAHALIAVRLDRISRSVADFAGLLRRAHRRDWRLVLLSPDLDTKDPAGRFTAHVLAAAAEYERDLIGSRTREGMAQRRREGVHVGRPRGLESAIVERIVAERTAGATLREIAAALEADSIPTAHGGRAWYASTIRAVLASTTAVAARMPVLDDAGG
jgi:DNA invertase Pin-like site-specific DNA recombinase